LIYGTSFDTPALEDVTAIGFVSIDVIKPTIFHVAANAIRSFTVVSLRSRGRR
jgi:hypothetical protein